jgi:hypothetical protein
LGEIPTVQGAPELESRFDINMANNVSSEAVGPPAASRPVRPRSVAWAAMACLLAVGSALGEPTGREPDGWPPVVGATEIMVSDELSGLALRGFDPVTFFLGPAPKPGASSLELLWGGVAWRFVSEANREAFRRDPAVYAPRIGGYDPCAAAEGRLVAAEPSVFIVRDGRLYLFRNEESRRRFLEEAGLARAAEERWPQLKRGLVRP